MIPYKIQSIFLFVKFVVGVIVQTSEARPCSFVGTITHCNSKRVRSHTRETRPI